MLAMMWYVVVLLATTARLGIMVHARSESVHAQQPLVTVELASFEHGVAVWQPVLWDGVGSGFHPRHWAAPNATWHGATRVQATHGLEDNANGWQCTDNRVG